MVQFKVGDKVKIVAGGWGIHPCFVGTTVTISGMSAVAGNYKWEEDLVETGIGGVVQRGGDNYASWQSFELAEPMAVYDKIREINRKIKAQEEAHASAIYKLKAERELLITELIEELQ